MDGSSATLVICSSVFTKWESPVSEQLPKSTVNSKLSFLVSLYWKVIYFKSLFSVSFIAFLANGNRNSPRISSCYGLSLDGTKLVSRNKPLGGPGWEVIGSSQGSLPRENWGWWVVYSSGRVHVFFLLSLPFLIKDVSIFKRSKILINKIIDT